MEKNKFSVKNGIDNIKEYDNLFKNKVIGLVTNVTGVDKNYNSTVDIINNLYNLKLLFAPEHGLRGECQAGDKVENYIDNVTGKEVISLYGNKNIIIEDKLDDIDILVYDIQDLGVRYYTYIYTMYLCMKACSRKGVEFIILDRINPLGGNLIEGNILESKYNSFIGMLPITNIYGLTVGELAKYIKDKENIDCNLNVVPITGWKRGITVDETDLPWVPTSPNIPTLECALVYGGTCLFEGTNISEGRGTTKPFEMIGAPWIDCNKLSERLNNKNLPGVYFRPVYFVPTFSKYKEELCEGVQIHIKDHSEFLPLLTAINMLYEIKELYPNYFKYDIHSEGFKYKFFIHLTGCDYILNESLDNVIKKLKYDSNLFRESIKEYILY
ncbi:exo-beta-N-acetylmuramidase NamZ family protein [Clostridium uliginosum]|uniref:Uncharacterized conserved protein YbbC, DUF1343 family n=1 Tax=Clostridium uliginosum TaxID=119641 RepID=A0A1I1MZ62_9CLOT|nr:DUF1343 domain-containing protein [Clostridium uliginosum]SFC90744.1 Uncharacterized conserved protein YbbC, DUF1343 family [Clostridium uliginosum]